MTCKQYVNAVEDLKPAVEKLLRTEESNGDFRKASDEVIFHFKKFQQTRDEKYI